MTATLKNTLFAGAVALTMSSLAAAPVDNDWFERWYKAKYGSNAPAVEARLAEERASTAFREEAPAKPAAVNWIEEHYRAKHGRNTPAEEARLEALRESTAFREEPGEATPARTWFEEWFNRKYGRYPEK